MRLETYEARMNKLPGLGCNGEASLVISRRRKLTTSGNAKAKEIAGVNVRQLEVPRPPDPDRGFFSGCMEKIVTDKMDPGKNDLANTEGVDRK